MQRAHRLTMTDATHDMPPTLEVAQAGPASGGPGRWRVAFDVANRGAGPAALLALWLPHERFRRPEQPLADLVLPPGTTAQLAFEVAFDERPGTEVENCFVILRVDWRDERWRVMTRLTVTAGHDGAPGAATQLVTAHRVGFSA